MSSASLPLGAFFGLLVLAVPAGAQMHFTDVTESAGLFYLQHLPQLPPDCSFESGSFCQPERMSGGAAVADVDGDGDVDLFVTRFDAPDLLFENQGDGTFVDAATAAGLSDFDLQSNGAAFGDIDNDGDADLVVTVLGESDDPVNDRNFLFINDGSGFFTEDAVARGVAVPTQAPADRMTFSVVFGDYDRDGWIDLHVTEWESGPHSRLLRNLGTAKPGYFTDVTAEAGLDFLEQDGFASAFADMDGDGWPDLVVAADFGTSRLYWNDGDGTFTDGTAAAGVGTDENGMGSAIGDYDSDGDLDWFVTAIYDPSDPCGATACNWGSTGNRLYRNDGGRHFTDQTDAAGVRDGGFGWGAVFFDGDNDGDLDLAMTNGVDFHDVTLDDPFHADPMLLFENDGSGGMVDVAAGAGATDTGTGKGLLVFDYDGDGDLDLFVVNNGGSPRLYRNDSVTGNRWLRVEARGSQSNADALGARVEVQATQGGPIQVREVGVNSHFLGQSEREAHFGVGSGIDQVHRVWITFPSGRRAIRSSVPVDTLLVVHEPVRGHCGLLGMEPLLLLAMIGFRSRHVRRSG